MADTKISALSSGGAIQDTDEFVVARAGTNVKIAGSEITGLGGNTIISDQTLGADTQVISFTSIAASWTHLRLLVSLRTDSSNNDIGIRFNGDSGANYDFGHVLSNNSVTAAQGVATTTPTAGYCASSGSPANHFGLYQIIVPFYLSSTHKLWINSGWVEITAATSGIYYIAGGGTWKNTAAITQIDLRAVSKFVAGSRAILYGSQ